jgi:hypothetical protein
MESISSAATTIGIISFSFQFTYHLHYFQSPLEAKEQINSNFGALISSIAALSNVLHILETQPRNPMVPLPAELEAAAQACASDLSQLEASLRLQQVKSESLVRSKMELKQGDVEKMQGILQTHIGVLRPYTSSCSQYVPFPPNAMIGKALTDLSYSATNSKRLEEANHVPEGMTQQAKLDISTQTYHDGTFRRIFHESIITTIGFQYLDYYSNENVENTQVLYENMELSSNMRGVMEQLFEGKVTYSRRQLYELLSLLKELYDFGATRVGQGWKQRKAMLESQWWPKILACLRRLSNLAGILPTESPSVEAHEAIVALKLLAIGVRRSFDGGTHDQIGFQGQHNSHVGIVSENEESRCLTVKFTVGPIIRGSTIRRRLAVKQTASLACLRGKRKR